MTKYAIAAAWLAIAALLSPGAIRASSIAVPNYSFETPATPFVSVNIDSWQKSPQPSDYQTNNGFDWTQLTGIFKNSSSTSSDHIDNCDGAQALWLFAVPGVGLFQDYNSSDYHNLPPSHQLNAICQPGNSYQLTVGVIGTGGGMNVGATLALTLYYRNASSNQVPIATTVLTNDPSVFSNNTHFVDCQVTIPAVKPGDPWAGQHLGILLQSTVDSNLQGGYWDLDNVRLVEIPTPLLLGPAVRNGQFQFQLVGSTNLAFEILKSTNAAASLTNWVSAGIITNSSGTISYTEPVGGGLQWFYRARQLPQ